MGVRRIALLLVAVLVLSLAACSGPEELPVSSPEGAWPTGEGLAADLVGVWVDPDPEGDRDCYEFFPDGTGAYSYDVNRRGFQGRYRYPITYQLEGDTLEIVLEGNQTYLQIRIEGQDLILGDWILTRR